MSTPTCVFLFILAVLGLYELLFAAVSFLFLAPETRSCGIIELRGRMENAEFLIRSALLRHQGRIYIIDCGADYETLHIARIFALDCSRITILRSEETAFMLGEDII